MAFFKTLFILSLLFAVVLITSSKASAGNEPSGVAQTKGGAQVDGWRGGGWGGGGRGGGWGGGGRGGGGRWGGGGGRWGGGGGRWGGGGGRWGGGGGGRWPGRGRGGCHYPYCKKVAGGDAQAEAKSGEKHMP